VNIQPVCYNARMNAEDIDKLEAGRELDALIAEKVMGWTWCVQPHGHISRPGKYSYTRWLCEPDRYRSAKPKWDKWDGKTEMPISGLNGEYMHVLEYSTDIAAAWEVVEKMRELDMLGDFSQACDFLTPWSWLDYSKASDMALFICRAALKAISAQQSLEESECMVGGHPSGCRCHMRHQQTTGAGK